MPEELGGDFEFQLTSSDRLLDAVSFGFETQIIEVEVPRPDQLPNVSKALASVSVPAVFNTILGLDSSGPTSLIATYLAERGLTTKDTAVYVATLADGTPVTYLLRRLVSDSATRGTHRINFFGDARTGEPLTQGPEVATIVRLGDDPQLEWTTVVDGEIKSASVPLKERRVLDIPLDQIPEEFRRLVFMASTGTKSHGH